MTKLLYFFLLIAVSNISLAQSDLQVLTHEDVEMHNNTITAYLSNYKDIIIPPYINGQEVKIIGRDAFHGRKINSVRLPKTLLGIKFGAFAFNYISDIELPSNLNLISKEVFTENEFEFTMDDLPKQEGFIWEKVTYFYKNTRTGDRIKGTKYIKKAEGKYVIKDRDVVFKNNKIIRYIGPSGDLILPELINGELVEIIGEEAFSNAQITSIQLSNCIRKIESKAFYNNKLSYIHIPESVQKIESSAFRKNQLCAIILPSKIYYLGEKAFLENKLKSIQLPKINTEGQWVNFTEFEGKLIDKSISVIDSTSLSNTFTFYAEDYTIDKNDVFIDGDKVIDYFGPGGKITIPNIIGEVEIKTLHNFNSHGFSEVIIKEGIDRLGTSCFAFNKMLKVTLPESVQTIADSSFYNNYLKKIKIPTKLISIEKSTFADNQIEKIIFNDHLKSIHTWSFSSNQLEEIELPNSLKFIGQYAFSYNKLDDITLPDEIKIIRGWAFSNNPFDKDIHVGKSIEYIGEKPFGKQKYTYIEDPNIQFFSIKLKNDYEVYWENETWKVKHNINKAVEPQHFIFIRNPKKVHELKDYEVVFSDNTIVKCNVRFNRIKIPEYINGQKVKKIGEKAFVACKLNEVILPNTLEEIGDKAFYDVNLKKITLSASASLRFIGEGAFANNNLTSLTLPNKVEYIGNHAFKKNGQLSTLHLGENLTYIGDYAFSNGNISSIELHENLKYVGEKAFMKNKLTSLTIPKSIEKIDEYAFGYNQIKTITFEATSQLKSLGTNAFYGNFLTSISLPNSLTYIGKEALDGNDLTTVSLPRGVSWMKDYAPYSKTTIDDFTVSYIDKKTIGTINEVVLITILKENQELTWNSNVVPMIVSEDSNNIHLLFRKNTSVSLKVDSSKGEHFEFDFKNLREDVICSKNNQM
ncbi:leucine-rich repeat protein [Flammeovirga yaeyamensis]|uniref:Leucine-rich repeat protein n=1 Tax=Flammeovirga yaeyamensis TaxID=367791 RepID=A0AAX1N684_9BACT|nr:leucine-rich repeat domain-containing protein [Flammeovirga yaeyamensis]MBB3697536.1 hypothetical protein [Flammeovirga yaeyamensis]NMF36230.1 leucine-rich repeat domain-containing protein [Flammeovirga yaeyamensis]QWG02959.1 leucine-rich repeat protein [Flammeovirga yaeyamensis]